IILPRRSYLPFWTAMATGSFFLVLLFGLYWLAPVSVLATVALFLLWPASLGQKEDFGPVEIGCGESAPLDAEVFTNVTVLASRTALVVDATVYASLLFGGLFLLVVAPNWTGIAPLDLPVWPGIVAVLASGTGMASSWLARRTIAGGGPSGMLLAGAALAQTIGAAALIVMMA